VSPPSPSSATGTAEAPFTLFTPGAKPPLGGLRPGRRRPAGDRGGGEVALGVALAAQVEVIVLGAEEATPVKVRLDPSDRMLQHIPHLAGLQRVVVI